MSGVSGKGEAFAGECILEPIRSFANASPHHSLRYSWIYRRVVYPTLSERLKAPTIR